MLKNVKRVRFVQRRVNHIARTGVRIGVVGPSNNRVERETRSRADQFLQLLGGTDARNLNDDPFAALSLNDRFPSAHLVDSAPDDLQRLPHSAFIRGRSLFLRERDDHFIGIGCDLYILAADAHKTDKRASQRRNRFNRLVDLFRSRDLHPQFIRRRVLTANRADDRPLLPQSIPDVRPHRVYSRRVDFFKMDFRQKMRAASEVQSKIHKS